MNGAIVHECPEGTFICRDITHKSGYGEAIHDGAYYNKDYGHWIISNGEYGSCVNFCPYCGIDLRTLPITPSPYSVYKCKTCGWERVDYRFIDKDATFLCPEKTCGRAKTEKIKTIRP